MNKMDEKEQRAEEFVENLGHGKSMVEIEQEEPMVEEPDNPEDILSSEISSAFEKTGEAPKEKIEQLFQIRCEGYSKVKKQLTDFDNRMNEATKHIDEQYKKLQEERIKIYNEQFKGEGEVLNSEKDRLKGLIEDTFPKKESEKIKKEIE